jgi:hypothetical protein
MPTITSLPSLSTTTNLNNVLIPVVDTNSGVPVGRKVVTQSIVNSAVNAAAIVAALVASTATGYIGSTGATGISGAKGYTGSIGAGYTGSASTTPGPGGYTGSRGAGYTGSASTAPGYTGSLGLGYTGSMGPGYVGSRGLSSITARTTLAGTATSLANNSTASITISGSPSYFLLSLSTNNSAWVRLYVDNASRVADAARPIGTDPTYGSGVITEVITLGPSTQLITPSVAGFNNDSPATDSIYCAVTNLSGATNTITVTLNIISLGV